MYISARNFVVKELFLNTIFPQKMKQDKTLQGNFCFFSLTAGKHNLKPSWKRTPETSPPSMTLMSPFDRRSRASDGRSVLWTSVNNQDFMVARLVWQPTIHMYFLLNIRDFMGFPLLFVHRKSNLLGGKKAKRFDSLLNPRSIKGMITEKDFPKFAFRNLPTPNPPLNLRKCSYDEAYHRS